MSDLDFSQAAAAIAANQTVQAQPADAHDNLDFSAAAGAVAASAPQQESPHPEDEQRHADFLRWRVGNETRAPEEQAEILRMSTALGWTPDVVAGDLQKARNAVAASNLNAEDVVRAHPALADFLGDPRTTPIARSDTQRLTGLSYLLGDVQASDANSPKEPVFDGVGDVTYQQLKTTPGAVELWFRQRAFARDTLSLESQLMAGTKPDENAPAEPVYNGVGDVVSMKRPSRPLTEDEKNGLRSQIQKNKDELGKLKNYGDGVEELSFVPRIFARTARMLVEMGPEMAKGTVASAAGSLAGGIGGVATGTAFWASETAPDLYWQLSELKGPDGKALLSEEESKNYAMAMSLPIGALNAVSLEGLGASLTKWKVSQPIAEKVVSLLAKDGVEKILAQRTIPGAIAKAAFHYGTHVVQGGLMMGGQSALTQATLEVASRQHGVDAPGSVSDAFGDGFTQGVKDFALLSAWGPVRKHFAERGQILASLDSADTLRQINENVANSTTFKLAPSEGARLVENMGGDKTAYVDREAFDELAQERKVSPRELAANILGDDGSAYDRATAGNTDLAIPLSKWAEKVVMSEGQLAEKLSPDTRLALEEMTPRQAKERMKAIGAELQDRADERGPSFEQGVKELRDTLKESAKTAGHKNDQADAFAETVSRHAATMSLRLNVSLRDALIRTGLPQLKLEGTPVLGALAEKLKLTPEEKSVAEGSLSQAGLHVSPVPGIREVDLSKARSSSGIAAEGYGFYATDHEGIASLRAEGIEDRGHEPHTYQLDLPEDSSLLASRKKISEQHPEVLARLEKAGLAEDKDITGRDLYKKLEKRFEDGDKALRDTGASRPDEAASRFLLGLGIDGAKFPAEVSPGGKSGSNFVVWNPKRIQILGELPQKEVSLKVPKGADAEERRGTIRFKVDKAGRAHDFDIRALRGDASTLAHETGHFLSWSLHDLAESADAPADVKADYAALLKYGGWGNSEERLSENTERMKLAARDAALKKKGSSLEETDAEGARRLGKLEGKEEKLSHAWEEYLSEGKAPERGLNRVFARFRKWMGEVYGKLGGVAEQYRRTYGEDLHLSDEVRGIFGRLLAVDNEVADAQAEDKRLDVGGALRLSPEEEKRRQELLGRKYEAMREGLDQSVAGYNSDAAKGFLRAERERVRTDVHEEVSMSSPYRAMDFFLSGELRSEDGHVFVGEQLPEALRDNNDNPVRLSFDEAKKDVGEATAKLLRRRGLLTDKKGSAPGDIAPLLGFNDAKEMLESFAGAPDKDAVVENETARRMDEAFGPKMHEIADALSAAATNAAHNAPDILHDLMVRDAIAREIKAPAKRGGKLPREVLEQSAEQIVASSTLRDLSPKYFLDTERRMAREAKELLEKGFRAKEGGRVDEADEHYSDALHKWDAVLLAKTLWRHARDAQNEIAKSEAKLKRASKMPWAARLGLGDPTLSLADASDSILGALGFKKDVEPNPSNIDKALALMQRDGAEDIVQDGNGALQSALWDSQLMRDIAQGNHAQDSRVNGKGAVAPQGRLAWKDLTVDQARNVADAIENLAKTARDRNKLRIGAKLMGQEEFLDALAASSEKLSRLNAPANEGATGRAGTLPVVKQLLGTARATQRFFRSADASFTETYRILDRLTGGDLSHPAYKFFHDMREQARDQENRLIEKVGQAIQKQWSELPKEMRQRVFVKMNGVRDQLKRPDTGGIIDQNSPVTRSELWMIALNLGNAGNKDRLLKGYGWTERQVMSVLSEHLSAQEWKWVQGVWNTLGELYPHVEETHIADTGLRPEKVKAVPFQVTLPDGQVVDMDGGYFPVRYDPRVPMRNGFSVKQAEAAITTRVPSSVRPKTAQGATKARASNAPEDQLYLNFNVVPGHITQVIHDATHRLWVKQAASLFADDRFQTISRGRLGHEQTAAFGGWIRDVASQYANLGSDATRGMEKFFSWAKSSTTLSAVGANLAVPLTDLTNPMLPVIQGDLSPLHLSRTTRQLATRWSEMRTFALENSIELRARKAHGSQNHSVNIPGLTQGGFMGKVEHAAYAAMEATDRITVTPVWLAKYWETLDSTQDHDASVSAAEHLVQKYFPASDMASRAAILRDKGFLGYLTFLYGFGSKVYNINRATIVNVVDKWRDTDTSLKDASVSTMAALGSLAGQAILMGGIGDYLGGHGPKKKQDAAEWAKERALSYVAYQLPIFELMFSGRAALPSSGLVAKTKTKLEGVFTGKSGKGHQDQGPWESLAALGSFGVGTLAGRPGVGANQFLRAGQYLDHDFANDWRRGKYGNIASGLIYGDRGLSTFLNPSGE